MQTNRHAPGQVARRILSWASLIAIAGVLLLPLVLLAHAHLRRSEPAANDKLTTAPAVIRLWFSERPELAFTRVRLRAADSSEVALGKAARMSDDPAGVSLPIVGPLSVGSYTVLWRTAAVDGHPSSGSFDFHVVPTPVTTAAALDTSARPTAGHALVHVDSRADESTAANVSAATRWLEFMAMLAVVGVVAFRLLVVPRAMRSLPAIAAVDTQREIADSARRLAQSALVLLFFAALSRLYAEARAVLGADRAIDGTALRTIIGTSWGIGWVIGVLGVVVAAAGFLIVRRARRDGGWIVATAGALAIAVAPALTGHASATDPVGLALLADILHVLAACAWVGSLLALLFVSLPLVRGRRSTQGIGSGPLVASLVRAFHPLALTCASVVIVSGIISAWLRLPSVASLWESTYGRVLLLKLAFVAVVVILGALNWRRLLPILGEDAAARRITRTAGAELTFAALVLAATAVLVSTAPPDRTLGVATGTSTATR